MLTRGFLGFASEFEAVSSNGNARHQREAVNDMTKRVPFDGMLETCETFSGEWHAGKRPDIPTYLLKVAADDQATLLRNLLEYELQKRRDLGEQPRAEDYLSRLPDHTSVVRQVFLETSSLSLVTEAPRLRNAVLADRPPASRLGDFRLTREIGRGGMGAVYEAVHILKGHTVALKTLPAVNPETLHRFKREFRLVADVSHPNLVRLHTLENDGGQYFITMELVAGLDFRSWVRPKNQLDHSRLISSIPQLVAGVMALHARGIIHRDLKPQNVLVNSDGRLVILDFGLVAEMAGSTRSLAKIAGTPQYMAPEQGAGKAIGPPADWYAIGVMLYEAIVGKLPFESSNPWEILKQKADREAPLVPEAAGVPDDLVDLCNRLLYRSPEKRPDPLEIAGVVHSPASPSATNVITGDSLVGREMQLATLNKALEAVAKSTSPTVVFISGRSGEGKTSLADAFLSPLREGSAVVFAGRCYDRESVPFKALDALIDPLTDYMRSLPEQDVLRLLPDDSSILAKLFPGLNRCEVLSHARQARLDALDQKQMRARAFQALRLLLERVALDRQVILFIDDLQWGDEDSARALFEVLRPPNAPNLLFVGSYRSDETDDSPFLNAWREQQRANAEAIQDQEIRVGPLSLEQATELVVTNLGIDDSSLRTRAIQFHAQTGGNPFLLTELVGCFDPTSDTFYATDVQGVLKRKLSPLPDEARALLEIVSVSGQSLAPMEACMAANVAQESEDVIISMRNARLLRVIGNKLDTYHDKIRYSVIDSLTQRSKETLHRRLAEVIETNNGALRQEEIDQFNEEGCLDSPKDLGRVYDLAYHWDAAQEPHTALAYGLAAAQQARGQFALDVANEQYALAERNSSSASLKTKFTIAFGRAESLLFLGHFADAEIELTRAQEYAEISYDVASVVGLKGVLARKQGMVEESIHYLEDAIGRLGVPVPRTTLGLGLQMAKESIIQLVHNLFPNRLHKKKPDKTAELCNWLLGEIEWVYYPFSVPYLLWASFVGLNRAERLPPSPALCFQQLCHANDMGVLGWHSRATKYYERAQALSIHLNDQWGSAMAVSHYSMGSLAAAKYELGADKARNGKELFEKIGDVAEVHFAHLHLAIHLFRMGRLAEAVRESRDLLHSCVRKNDNFFGTWTLMVLSQSCSGKLPFDELLSSVELLPGNNVGETLLQMAEGFWHRHHGRTADSLASFENAWRICKKKKCLTTFNMSVLSDLATAYRMHAELLESSGQDSRLARKKWRRTSAWAARFSKIFPPEQPHAFRELALAREHAGRKKQAIQLLEKSCSVALKQKAEYQYLQSAVVQRRVAVQQNQDSSQMLPSSAEELLEKIESAAVAELGQWHLDSM